MIVVFDLEDYMSSRSVKKVTYDGVVHARSIMSTYLKETQLIYYKGLSDLLGAEIYVKHENHNPGGSFKIRGGINTLSKLRNQGVTGVITFSTGNHGISIATAAKIFGLEAVVVVPEGNNPAKNKIIRDAGATLIEAGADFEEAATHVTRLSEERNLYYVHAANEPEIIHGVGTEFLEIYEALPQVDVVMLPIGAGSELAGAVTVFDQLKPEIEIIAVQSEHSCAAYKSWKAGRIMTSTNTTFAGGFATGTAYELPFDIYKNRLADFVLLSEFEIEDGVRLALKHTKNLAEGSGASTIAAAFKIKDQLKGKAVVLQMSGCNIAMDKLVEIIKSVDN